MRLACCVLQLRPQVDREAERETHSGITTTRFHIAMISQRYQLCGPVTDDSGLLAQLTGSGTSSRSDSCPPGLPLDDRVPVAGLGDALRPEAHVFRNDDEARP
jgi:hypothetical protein